MTILVPQSDGPEPDMSSSSFDHEDKENRPLLPQSMQLGTTDGRHSISKYIAGSSGQSSGTTTSFHNGSEDDPEAVKLADVSCRWCKREPRTDRQLNLCPQMSPSIIIRLISQTVGVRDKITEQIECFRRVKNPMTDIGFIKWQK